VPGGRLLATGQFGPASHPVQVWDLANPQSKPIDLPDDELGGWAAGVAFSPDGKVFAACGEGLTVWRMQQREKAAADRSRLSFERVAHLPGRRSLYLRISANSKLLAWVDRDCSVCLWDLANEREIPFVGPPLLEGWHSLAFWPDSDHLTFGTAKRMFETWDARTARRVSSLGQVKEGTGVAASADGRWLTNADPTLWSSKTGSRGLALPPESTLIWSLAWSPDGERLAVGLADGGLVIWNVPKIQTELTRIGLAWRAEARPPQEQ